MSSSVRFYDPVTGTFLQRDPITPITREPYRYVGGNPLNLIDPSGLCGEPAGFIGPTLPCPSIFDPPRAPTESPVPTYWPSACLAQHLSPNAPCPPPSPAGCDDGSPSTAPIGGFAWDDSLFAVWDDVFDLGTNLWGIESWMGAPQTLDPILPPLILPTEALCAVDPNSSTCPVELA